MAQQNKFSLEHIKSYYSDPKRIIPDGDGYLLHRILADYIVSLSPEDVFEFGCNRGLNLLNIKKKNPDIHVHGCDINETAVKIAQKAGLDVVADDESFLNEMPEWLDLYFTCSVLNHIPDVDEIITNLKYLSKKYVVLMEAIEIPDHPRWFLHDYEKHGFTLHTTVKSEQGGCTYGLFSWHR